MGLGPEGDAKCTAGGTWR